MELAAILVFSILTFMLTIVNLVVLIFMGGGIANMGEVIIKECQQTYEKLENLDSEIKYRLPRRPYGVEQEDELQLTEGPDDSRIPR